VHMGRFKMLTFLRHLGVHTVRASFAVRAGAGPGPGPVREDWECGRKEVGCVC